MEKKLFLSDEPIEELAEDAFGHKAFVETLYKCVKGYDCRINIGLFGRWGVGKTSIVQLLTKRLRQDAQNIQTFFFDAWKYSHTSLPQEFILKLNKEYEIVKQDRLEAELYGIQEEEVPPIERGWKSTLQRIWHRFKISIVCTLLLLGLFMLLYHLGWVTIDVYTSLIFIVPLPIIVKLIIEMDSAITPMRKVKMLPAKLDPGRLENKFKEIVDGIVKNKKAEKLVIIIDNLDRCSGEGAIEMLEAIKTLMEHDKCVYILPCDYDALMGHLTSIRGYKESDAREFLRKFFQTSLTIPSFLAQDLEEFANNLLSSVAIPYGREVLQVVVSAFMENPRSIKQFLNNLTIQYLAAREREEAGIIRPGEITNRLDFLAKILILRQEYPSFYKQLEHKEDLLEEVETYLRKGGDPPIYRKYDQEERKLLEIDLLDNNPGLEQFLKSNMPITVGDISPFIRLNKETYPSTIPDAREFKLQVTSGNVDYISSKLGKLEGAEKAQYVERVIKVIDDASRVGNYLWVFNGTNMLIKIYDRIPPSIKQSVAAKIGYLMTFRETRDNLNKFDYSETFTVLRDTEEKYRTDILDQYMFTLAPQNIDRELIDQAIGIYDLMPQTAVDMLNARLVEAYGLNREETELTISRLIQQPEVGNKLISEELVARIEQSIDTSLNEENKKGINLYLKLKSQSVNQTKLSLLRKILGIISTNRNAVYDETKQFGLQILLMMDTLDVPKEGADELYKTLNEFTGLVSPPNEKLQFIKVFFRFSSLFPESRQEEFLHNHLLPLIDTGAVPILNNVLEVTKEYDAKILTHDFVLERFTNRVRTNLPDLGLIASITRNTPRQGKERVKDMIIHLINRPEPGFHNNGLESLKQLRSEFSTTQIGGICDALLQRATGVAKPDKKKFIDTILEAFENCPALFKRKFADFTLDFIRNDDNDIRNMGIDCFNKTEAQIKDDKRKWMIMQLVPIIEQKANQHAINEGSRPLLDFIVAKQAMLGRNDKVRLVDTLLDLRSEANPKEARLIGLEYLEKVDKLYHRRKLVTRTLQTDLEGADEDISKQAKKTLESFQVHAKKSAEIPKTAEANPDEF